MLFVYRHSLKCICFEFFLGKHSLYLYAWSELCLVCYIFYQTKPLFKGMACLRVNLELKMHYFWGMVRLGSRNSTLGDQGPRHLATSEWDMVHLGWGMVHLAYG